MYMPGFYSIILTNEIQRKKTDLANQKLPGGNLYIKARVATWILFPVSQNVCTINYEKY